MDICFLPYKLFQTKQIKTATSGAIKNTFALKNVKVILNFFLKLAAKVSPSTFWNFFCKSFLHIFYWVESGSFCPRNKFAKRGVVMLINEASARSYLNSIDYLNQSGKVPPGPSDEERSHILNPKDTVDFSFDAKSALEKYIKESEEKNAAAVAKDADLQSDDLTGENSAEGTEQNSGAEAGGDAGSGDVAGRIKELEAKLAKMESQLAKILTSDQPEGVKEAQAMGVRAQIGEVMAELGKLKEQLTASTKKG